MDGDKHGEKGWEADLQTDIFLMRLKCFKHLLRISRAWPDARWNMRRGGDDDITHPSFQLKTTRTTFRTGCYRKEMKHESKTESYHFIHSLILLGCSEELWNADQFEKWKQSQTLPGICNLTVWINARRSFSIGHFHIPLLKLSHQVELTLSLCVKNDKHHCNFLQNSKKCHKTILLKSSIEQPAWVKSVEAQKNIFGCTDSSEAPRLGKDKSLVRRKKVVFSIEWLCSLCLLLLFTIEKIETPIDVETQRGKNFLLGWVLNARFVVSIKSFLS